MTNQTARTFKFVCGNVTVEFKEYSLEGAFIELQRRVELASSCGVTLPNWDDFDMINA